MESQQPKILIVVPCYNEQTRFDLIYWKNVISSNPFVRFVFVNDGSSDETLRIIQEIGQASEVLSLEKNSGKSEAIRLGWLQYISESKWIGYGFIDSDGAFSPNDIQKLIEIFKVQFDSNSKVDVILSSRVALAGRKIERTPFRHYLGRIIATYISHNWPGSPYDTQSGFKLFIKTDCFRKAILEPFETRWFFDIELLVRLKSLKEIELRIWEEPLMSWKEIANSKIKKYEFLRILREIFIVKTIVRESVRLSK